MKGTSDIYNGRGDAMFLKRHYNGIPEHKKNNSLRNSSVINTESMSDEKRNYIQNLWKYLIGGVTVTGVLTSNAAAAALDHSTYHDTNGHADSGMQNFISGYGSQSHGDGIRTPPSDDIGKSADIYKKSGEKAKKITNYNIPQMSGQSFPYIPSDDKGSGSEWNLWDWVDDGLGGISDSFKYVFGGIENIWKSLRNLNNEAYATKPTTPELTEEQKIAERCKDPIYGPNADECKTTVSKENPQNDQKGNGNNAGNGDGALDASKKDIGNRTTPLPEDKMPVDWNALQKHYTAAKGEIKSDHSEECAYGSVGDSLVVGCKMKPGTPNDESITIIIQEKYHSEYLGVELNSDSYSITDMTTKPDDFIGSTYYSKDGWRILVVPKLGKKLKEDTRDYGIHIYENSDEVRAIELLDKNNI